MSAGLTVHVLAFFIMLTLIYVYCPLDFVVMFDAFDVLVLSCCIFISYICVDKCLL